MAFVLIAAGTASAATFTADPSIPDGSTTRCSPCSLREAVAEANASSDTENLIDLMPGAYTLTQGLPLAMVPQTNTIEVLVGEGARASNVEITAGGSSQVLNVQGAGDAAIFQLEATGGSGALGGGIAVDPGATLIAVNSEVTGNQATSGGGGIYVDGQLYVSQSTIAGNKVVADGGTAAGGGIDSVTSGDVSIVNSTIADNTVSGGGTNAGAGIDNEGSSMVLLSSTIAGNSLASSTGASLGAGLATGSDATTSLANTIISNNTSGVECSGMAPTSEGGNIADDSSCSLGATGDRPSTNPLLAGSPGSLTLTNNGGPTDTIALQSGSPAIDGAPTIEAGFSFCPSVDQRGYSRADAGDPSGINCDIGAYELGATGPPTPVVSGISPSFGPPAGGNAVTITGSDFTGATAVKFGSITATSFTVNSPTQITAIAPAGSGTVDVTVTTSEQENAFTFGGLSSATSAADRYSYGSQSAPSAVTGSPVLTGSAGAAFSGSVDPNGLATTVTFQYGLDPSVEGSTGPVVYTQSTPPQQIGASFTSQTVSAAVSGLLPNAKYHVQIVATNSAGSTDGPDRTFTTPIGAPPPPPVLGKSVDVKPVSGIVLIKLPGGHAADRLADAKLAKGKGFVPLTEARQLPTGTQVDARRGTLELVAASPRHAKTQTGTFGGAIFAIAQDRTGLTKGLTTLSLLESAFAGAPSYASCPKAAAGSAAARSTATDSSAIGTRTDSPTAQTAKASPKVLQTLKASDNHGQFRTKGRYSSASVLGTVWTMSDRCDGTLTAVKRGTVIVTDFNTRKTITLHAGQSFLASAIK